MLRRHEDAPGRNVSIYINLTKLGNSQTCARTLDLEELTYRLDNTGHIVGYYRECAVGVVAIGAHGQLRTPRDTCEVRNPDLVVAIISLKLFDPHRVEQAERSKENAC